VRWRTRMAGSNCVSPVCANGLLFVMADNGVLTCLDSKNGGIHWRKRLPGDYFSSLVVAGQYLYATNRDGATSVLEIQPKLELRSENHLEQPVQATLAVAHGRIYVRTESHVLAIDDRQRSGGMAYSDLDLELPDTALTRRYDDQLRRRNASRYFSMPSE